MKVLEKIRDYNKSFKEARDLAIILWKKHYKDDAPNWQPLDTLQGILSQIDNMTAGMTRKIEWSDESMEDCECIPCFKGEDDE